jgi:hypothetical protein
MADYIPSGNTFSTASINTLDPLLLGLADNTNNLIVAKNIRDSVYSLWDRIDTVSITAASASIGSYTNLTPVPTTVGGVTAGTTFNGLSMSAVFDLLLYPYTSPISTLSANNNPREYGSSPNVTLSWSITKKSEDIFQTTQGVSTGFGIPNGGSGTFLNRLGTHSNTPPLSYTNSFTMSVYDTNNGPYITTATLTWMNRIYWGAVPSISALIPMSAINLSAVILGLTGSLFGTGKELSTTKSKTYTNINAQGNYLIFAWPSNVLSPHDPYFTVNGLQSTAFSNVKGNTFSTFILTNANGFTASYVGYVSNTVQNSPLNIVIN